ncbi:hypothetical protein PIB30_091783, partial [Stylosanthes scabra]|nr:hypothetical protein [Stylosanthes scabra]
MTPAPHSLYLPLTSARWLLSPAGSAVSGSFPCGRYCASLCIIPVIEAASSPPLSLPAPDLSLLSAVRLLLSLPRAVTPPSVSSSKNRLKRGKRWNLQLSVRSNQAPHAYA